MGINYVTFSSNNVTLKKDFNATFFITFLPNIRKLMPKMVGGGGCLRAGLPQKFV